MVDKNRKVTQLAERIDSQSAVALTDKQRLSLYKKSQKSGISVDILEEVYSRGVLSWEESTNQTPEQYGFGRVNSFIAGGQAMELDEDLLTESTAALKKKAKKSGIPLSILKQVYKRGIAAWRTGHRPGTTPQQWALARVNSFITKGSGTWGKADKDLAAKARKAMKKKVNEEADMIAEAMADKYRTGNARTDARRERHFDRGTAMNDDNPEAYRDAPGDKEARARGIPESEHTKRYRRMYGEEHCECDYCMAERQSTNPDDSSSRFEGTDSLVDIYKAMTPGQSQVMKAVKEAVRDIRESQELSEKATSRAQQRLMGAALAYKRNETDSASPEVRRLASEMSEKQLEDFARTKHRGLPERVEEQTLPRENPPIAPLRNYVTNSTIRGSGAGRSGGSDEVRRINDIITGRDTGRSGGSDEERRINDIITGRDTGRSGGSDEERRINDIITGPDPEWQAMSQSEREDYLADRTGIRRSVGSDGRVILTRVSDGHVIGSDHPRSSSLQGRIGLDTPFTMDDFDTPRTLRQRRRDAGMTDSGDYRARPSEREDPLDPRGFREQTLEEATFKGKKVKLNKPFRTPGGKKKFAVYVDPDGDGKAQIVRFGDPNMSIKKNQPGRKKSYCARSKGIGKLNDKTSANYWSRKMWDC